MFCETGFILSLYICKHWIARLNAFLTVGSWLKKVGKPDSSLFRIPQCFLLSTKRKKKKIIKKQIIPAPLLLIWNCPPNPLSTSMILQYFQLFYSLSSRCPHSTMPFIHNVFSPLCGFHILLSFREHSSFILRG